MRFTNGKLNDFKIEDLMEKVKNTGKSLNTIRENGDDIYYISIHYKEIFGLPGKDDPNTEYFIDIVKEDENRNQERIFIMEDNLYGTDNEIINYYNKWIKTVNLEECLKEDVNVNELNSFIGKPLKDFLKTIDHRTKLNIDGKFQNQGDSGDTISGMSGLAHDVSWYMAENKIKDIEIADNDKRKLYDYKIITENYSDIDQDDAYSTSEVFNSLIQLTDNFTKKSGTIRTYFEEEKDLAKAILRNKYKYLDISDGRRTPDEEMNWVIAYENPIMTDFSFV